MTYDFSICKLCNSSGAIPRYFIRDGITIYCCPSCSGHYIDYLDNTKSDADGENKWNGILSQTDYDYIDKQLQINRNRYISKVDLLLSYCKSGDLKVLDIGAGGGLFIHLLKQRGICSYGIEPNAMRVQFAKEKYGLQLSSRLIDDPYWQNDFSGYFDAITLWDVIEHVNFPREILLNANKLLKDDGLLLIDTPNRDSFYYRAGILSYNLTLGALPSFLNIMYSKDAFSHKQIFSSKQLTDLLEQYGFKVIALKNINELSFPYIHYLKRLFHSEKLSKIMEPILNLFFRIVRIHNKIVLVAQLKHKPDKAVVPKQNHSSSRSIFASGISQSCLQSITQFMIPLKGRFRI